VIRVYGVTGVTAGRIGVRGMSGETLSGVAAGGVRAIVGTAPRTSRASVDALQRYDRVVRALWSTRPALLPARFGTEFETVEDLKRMLVSRPMTADVRRVRGRAQMIVRVLGVTTGPRQDATRRPRASSGTAYLHARAADAARARHIPGFDDVRGRVARFVRGERVEPWKGGTTVYHLIPRGSATAYRRTLEQGAAAAGIRVVVTGPHPPYAFA
jgi:hypothetical protein